MTNHGASSDGTLNNDHQWPVKLLMILEVASQQMFAGRDGDWLALEGEVNLEWPSRQKGNQESRSNYNILERANQT